MGERKKPRIHIETTPETKRLLYRLRRRRGMASARAVIEEALQTLDRADSLRRSPAMLAALVAGKTG